MYSIKIVINYQIKIRENFPVCGFLTQPTVFEYWGGGGGGCLALLDPVIHLVKCLIPWIFGSRTYAGNSSGWELYGSLLEDLELVHTYSGDIPLDMWGGIFFKWTAWAISIGQRLFSLVSGHISASWIIMVLSIMTTLLIELYVTLFWWWPHTPLWPIPWPLPCTLWWNPWKCRYDYLWSRFLWALLYPWPPFKTLFWIWWCLPLWMILYYAHWYF